MIISSTLLIGILFGCIAPIGVQHSKDSNFETGNHTVIVVQNPISLADILVQVPGVVVTRNFDQVSISIRGGTPLYVIDGLRIGHSYNEALELVNVFDIEYVEVIKGASESAIYGPGSGHGVIRIVTKGASEIEG